MDCPKCGYSLNTFEKDCPRCRRITAEEFAKSPAAVWPPVIAGQSEPPPHVEFVAPPVQELDDSHENTSGSEYGLPLDVAERQWNWGAFFFSWLWCLFNGLIGSGLLIIGLYAVLTYFTIVILPSGWYIPSALIALVIFGTNCYLGINGHRLAWENRRFVGGESQFFQVQRTWAITGIAIAGVSTLVIVAAGIKFTRDFQAYEARKQRAVPVAAAPAPVVSNGPAPIILRQNPPEAAPMPPVMGGQGFRHPWDNTSPNARQYRPGYGPGDIRTTPTPDTVPSATTPVSQPAPVSATPPDTMPATPVQNNSVPADPIPAPSPAPATVAPPNTPPTVSATP